MKSKATFFSVICVLWSVAIVAQGQGAAQAPPPPAVDTVAPDIPGVVKGGTKVQVIKDGFTGTEGPIALPDGSLIFTETAANRITRIDKDNTISTFLENSNGSNGLAKPDGTVANGRNFAKYERTDKTQTGITSGADGLAIDSEGRVYTASLTGVQVFSRQGQHLGTIPVSRPPQNIAFAGPDKKTLYIVGRGAAYKVQMLAQGFKDRAK